MSRLNALIELKESGTKTFFALNYTQRYISSKYNWAMWPSMAVGRDSPEKLL